MCYDFELNIFINYRICVIYCFIFQRCAKSASSRSFRRNSGSFETRTCRQTRSCFIVAHYVIPKWYSLLISPHFVSFISVAFNLSPCASQACVPLASSYHMKLLFVYLRQKTGIYNLMEQLFYLITYCRCSNSLKSICLSHFNNAPFFRHCKEEL